MATYNEIQQYVKRRYGYLPKTCWIADVKEKVGYPLRKAWNRRGAARLHPCPANKAGQILEAIKTLEGARS